MYSVQKVMAFGRLQTFEKGCFRPIADSKGESRKRWMMAKKWLFSAAARSVEAIDRPNYSAQAEIGRCPMLFVARGNDQGLEL